MRKERLITIPDRGRSLTFKVREMPAEQAESWIWRVFFLLCKSGSNSMNEVQNALADVMNGTAKDGQSIELIVRALGGMSFTEAKPLLDELLACCSRIVDGIEQQCTAGTLDGYVENFLTIMRLRIEAARLCFFSDVSLSGSLRPAEPQPDSNKKPAQSPIRMSQG